MSDLDKEELEATRKMQSSAESAEKTADEMFEELGYEEDIGFVYGLIRYIKDDDSYIRFIIDEKSVEVNRIIDNKIDILSVDMELLKIINLKCKELRVVE